ncbi:MAG: GNAT family N-acetyltransferase [Actinomycetota bacterium]|nr:GNAT family N-acetyltransferase [Actinomycetota bacterium]
MRDTGYTIRPGRREDATDAARLWVRSAEEHASYDPVYTVSSGAEKTMRHFLADLTSSSHTFLFLAISSDGPGEETIGFISGELREGSPTFSPRTWASVDDVYVVPEQRSRGVGRSLIERVKDWSREKGANGVSLQVAAANDRGRDFYRNLGFREVSVYEVLEL